MVLEYFNLYDVFINQIFGGVLFGVIGFMVLLFILGSISRMSFALIIGIEVMFIFTWWVAYWPLLAVLMFMISMIYFVYQVYQFFFSSGTG